jgi:lysophospholipase L1-like esterase
VTARRRWRQWTVLATFYAAVLVVATEVGVRLLVPVPDQFFASDPVVGVRHIAGKSGRWRSPEFDVPVRINRLGFRDRERTEAKAAGARRIVVLGDSITEALQVPLDDSFPSVLEARLAGGRTPIEVLNLGVSATGTAQQYLLFRERGRRYAPDVVVVAFFTGNDYRNNSRALNGDPALPYPVIGPDGRVARGAAGAPQFTAVRATGPVRQFLREHLASYRFLAARVRGTSPLTAWLPRVFATGRARAEAPAAADEDRSDGHYRRVPSAAWRAAMEVTFELFGDLDAEVRGVGAALFVAIIPAPWEISRRWPGGRPAAPEPGWDVERPERMLLEALEARRIPAVSVRDALRAALDRGHEVFFPQDGHLTARGHRVVGDALAATLRERGLVQ